MLRLSLAGLFAAFLLLSQGSVCAQVRDETLADIRQQLVALYVEMERLRRELFPGGSNSSTGEMQRLDDIESKLRNTISQVEGLEFRILKIAENSSRRIRDLEYKLVELEGGDLSALEGGTTLGGDNNSIEVDALRIKPEPAEQNAVRSERQLFETARSMFELQNFEEAVRQFRTFLDAYPSSPYTAEAHFILGEAFAGQRNWKDAASSYLDSFNSDKEGPTAPRSLFGIGESLGKLGTKREACLVLASVGKRFPASEQSDRASDEMMRLECS